MSPPDSPRPVAAPRPFDWLSPPTLADALAALTPGTLVKAGGVDVMDRLKEGLDAPARVLNLRAVPGLDGVRAEPDALVLGPLVTLTTLAAHPVVRRDYPGLAAAAGHAATPQIRNSATLGGNLLQRPRCWYFRRAAFPCLRKGGQECFAQTGRTEHHAIFENDLCAMVAPSSLAPPLIALGASVEITGRTSGPRRVPVERLFLRPGQALERETAVEAGDLVTGIVVPRPAPGVRSACLAASQKARGDWVLAEVAVTLAMNGERCAAATIVLGAVAPVPWRASRAEAALTSGPLTAERVRAAVHETTQQARPFAENRHKVEVLAALMRRAILDTAEAARKAR